MVTVVEDVFGNSFTRLFAAAGAFGAGVLEDVATFYNPLIPLFLIAVVLIVVDCRFGVELSKKNREKIRTSRMVRRSVNKFVDYFCWVTIAGLLGFVYGTPLHMPNLELFALAGVYGLELNSIVNNYLELKGINLRLNFMKWFKRKTGTEDLIEDYDRDRNNRKLAKRNNSGSKE